CFRAGIINIGAEGQIAVGGMGTAAVALVWPNEASALAAIAALVGGAAAGAVWAGVATAIHLWRRVHEVLATLLLNFVALLLVLPFLTWSVMLLAGALAGLAGGIELLGLHHRLIEGFSLGFGFKAVTVALLGALEPMAIVPAALFVGLLEAGSLSMQRQIGVPS